MPQKAPPALTNGCLQITPKSKRFDFALAHLYDTLSSLWQRLANNKELEVTTLDTEEYEDLFSVDPAQANQRLQAGAKLTRLPNFVMLVSGLHDDGYDYEYTRTEADYADETEEEKADRLAALAERPARMKAALESLDLAIAACDAVSQKELHGLFISALMNTMFYFAKHLVNKHGVDVQYRDTYDVPPLFAALKNSAIGSSRWLIEEMKQDLHEVWEGQTPFVYAKECASSSDKWLLANYPEVQEV